MALYKLLVGLHVGADYSGKPTKARDADGNEAERYPSRAYKPGEVVDSDVDLEARFGPEKFKRVGEGTRRRASASTKKGDPAPDVLMRSPAVAPGGQVAEGFQETTTGPDGKPVSGAARPETVEKILGRARAEDAPGVGEDAAEEDDGLESHSVKDLREMAEADEVDLAGAHRKDDIVAAIRRSRKGG